MFKQAFNWLKKDWHLRLIALVLAIYFWHLQDKPATVTYAFPVSPTNLSSKLALVSDLPKVEVTLNGLQRDLAKVNQGSIRVLLDMSVVRVPGKQRVPVEVEGAPQGVRVVKYEPTEVIVDVDRKLERTLRVQAKLKGECAAGYGVKRLEIQPVAATVKGAERFVSQVRSLGAVVDITGLKDDLISSETLQAFDADEKPLNQLDISPPMAQFVIEIAPKAPFQAKVKVRTTGHPAKGLKLKSIKVTPEQVTVAFKDARTRKNYVIYTEPLELDDKSASFTQEVQLKLPERLAYINKDTVRVEVELVPNRP